MTKYPKSCLFFTPAGLSPWYPPGEAAISSHVRVPGCHGVSDGGSASLPRLPPQPPRQPQVNSLGPCGHSRQPGRCGRGAHAVEHQRQEERRRGG